MSKVSEYLCVMGIQGQIRGGGVGAVPPLFNLGNNFLILHS